MKALTNLKGRSARAAIAVLGLVVPVASSWAARDFTPQAGTWVISEELDGKPGRGLAIDVQGNTFFMQVFGYEKNGDATFYTATGQMDGNRVTAPLMQYQGGRSFGSEARDAVEAGSAGNVTVSFTNGLHGSIQLPGEKVLPIQRFEVRSAQFEDDYLVSKNGGRSFQTVALDGAGQPVFYWRGSIGGDPKGMAHWINLEMGGAYADFSCLRTGADMYSCSEPIVRPLSSPRLPVNAVELRISAGALQGFVDVNQNGVVQRYSLLGRLVTGMKKPGISIPECPPYSVVYAEPFGSCTVGYRVPASGTWVVESELNGKPGRGFALDFQNGVAIAQVFNYQPGGQPTFHMGSVDAPKTPVTLPLGQYAGGRYLGGPGQAATLLVNAGSMRLEFVETVGSFSKESHTVAKLDLPGEPTRRLVRMELEPDAKGSQSLLGQWVLSDDTIVSLTRDLGSRAANADETAWCERAPQEPLPHLVSCQWMHVYDDKVVWQKANLIMRPNSPGSALQIRDRHGNLTGLGLLQD